MRYIVKFLWVMSIAIIAIWAILLGDINALAAPTDENNLTSTGFKIDLGAIDPINDRSNQWSVPKGKEAFMSILKILSNALLSFIPLIAAVSFIIAGYFYILSFSDTEKIQSAKNIIKYNIIAIFVAFLSWGIIQLIVNILNASNK